MDAACAIPRRGSIHESDPDYDPLFVRLCGRFEVLLDGEPVPNVFSYNCDAGWIRRYQTDSRGRLRFNPLKGVVQEEVLRGSVSVRWR